MNAGEIMAFVLIAFVVLVLVGMWRACILRPCRWEHQFDVPKVEMPMEAFGVYQCAHCKRISTGSPRWMEGF
jgi:hypothetical protein